MDLVDSLNRVLSPIIEFLDGYGIDLYSLLLGIIIMVAILLIARRSRRRRKIPDKPYGEDVGSKTSGVRRIRPRSTSQGEEAVEVVAEAADEPESGEPASAAVPVQSGIGFEGSKLRLHELRIQITLGGSAEVEAEASVEAEVEVDKKPRKAPSGEDPWEQPPR